MADLYGASSSPAPECEEISSFLHQLLHNSASSSSLASPLPPHLPPPPPAAVAELSFCGDERNYSDQVCYFPKGSARGGFSGLAYLNGDSEKVAGVSVQPRSSSKRSRAPEVHNLSEKRRRSRINEKMKALQNLIPNSNKTDKASMLDEAIEYLKQLQLQVQMLTMRNGLSLHPMCLPGVFQPMQLPQKGMGFDEGSGLLNADAPTGAFSGKDENSAKTSLSLPNRCTVSNQSIVLPSATNITSSETRFGSSD